MDSHVPLSSAVSALNDLLPAMEADGGGAELVSFENGDLTVQLTGTCLFCPSRRLSAAALERGLRNRIPGLRAVRILYPETNKARKGSEFALFQLTSSECASR